MASNTYNFLQFWQLTPSRVKVILSLVSQTILFSFSVIALLSFVSLRPITPWWRNPNLQATWPSHHNMMRSFLRPLVRNRWGKRTKVCYGDVGWLSEGTSFGVTQSWKESITRYSDPPVLYTPPLLYTVGYFSPISWSTPEFSGSK